MMDWARARREAIRKQADLRRRLAAAEQALADAQALATRAEAAFDAANARFTDAESALDAARTERARLRHERYQARQAHERASTTVERLRRRVDELGGRLDRMPPLTPAAKLAVTSSPGYPAGTPGKVKSPAGPARCSPRCPRRTGRRTTCGSPFTARSASRRWPRSPTRSTPNHLA